MSLAEWRERTRVVAKCAINRIMRLIRGESGASATEYALLIGLIAMSILVLLSAVGGALNGAYLYVINTFSSVQ